MKSRTIWIIVGLIAVVLLAYLASRVGGIAARGVRSGDVDLDLVVSQPVVPGVEMSVRWQPVEAAANANVTLLARTARSERAIGSGQLADGQAVAIFPCDLGQDNVGVSLASVDDENQQSVLAWTTVEVLPPGPDCLR